MDNLIDETNPHPPTEVQERAKQVQDAIEARYWDALAQNFFARQDAEFHIRCIPAERLLFS